MAAERRSKMARSMLRRARFGGKPLDRGTESPHHIRETSMSKYIRYPLALALALAVGACAGDDSASDSALATDSALNADLELAGQDTAAQPQLSDVPAGQTPSTSRPAT